MSLTRCPEGHLFSSRRYGNICPYCNKSVVLSDKNYEAEDTQGNYNENVPYLGDLEVMEPVTGWLVCIDGPSKGRDYRILTEKNFLGRADDMDIQVLGDNHIAKRNHAVFVYDPKKRQTVLLPGDSQGLVYVNGDAVYSPVELSAYDEIEIGKSKFLFIPLCGDHFEWTDIDQNQNRKDEKV
ncbi:FHA domain-containing protein [Defluviitalea phaphyphila]|uniref:FHA domain-containing protein n=1 Tax=Defluviitalea phaphyphila TaxID=1473580 RepID=UPI000730FE9A|nr:FHA domain-containing protein [Defluviitalea phaphyphila]